MLQWIALPDERIEVLGLPWFGENAPELWRLPKDAMTTAPEGVRRQAAFPAGARLRLRTDSSQLQLRTLAASPSRWYDVDVYVDGECRASVALAEGEQTVECLAEGGSAAKEITLYLPYRQSLQIIGVGVDAEAEVGVAASFSREAPLVLYGSSVAQGAGAAHPGMSYAAILARALGVDFVNLGFGGAGKAEPEVVDLVAAIPASCYLFDLGKSYGQQSPAAYAAMLETIRSRHPEVPVVCMTPIFSTREVESEDYAQLSRHTREAMRRPALARLAAGDDKVTLVEGLDLLGADDADGLSADGVHPNDDGFALIAERLAPYLAG